MWHLTIEEKDFVEADLAAKKPLPGNYVLGLRTQTNSVRTKPRGRYGFSITEVREDFEGE